MKRFTKLYGSSVLAVGLFLLAGNGSLRAQSPETTPSVIGGWRGIYEPGPNTTPSVIEITAQDFRRFEGMMQVGDLVYDIAGTVAADDSVHIVGKGEAGILIGLLKFTDLGDDGALLEGTLMLHLPNGEKVIGDLQVLRNPKQPGE